MLESLPARTAKLLEDAGITTAVAALQAGKDGLTKIKGIGDATADEILTAAQTELSDAAPAQANEVNTPNNEPEETAVDGEEAAVDAGTDKAEEDESPAAEEPDPDEDEAEEDESPAAEEPDPDEDEAEEDEVAEERPRPDTVVMRLSTLTTAIINGRVIYQGETRRVPYAHYELAVQEYPGAWLVRFYRDEEFEAA